MGFFKPNIEKMKAKKDVGGLIKALKDKDGGVRVSAVVALGEIGEPAVEPLIEAVRDEDEDVRVEAAEALIKIGDERAVDPLIQYLKGAKEWVLLEVARFFRGTGKRPDKFDLVYRASIAHEEIHYEGRDIEEVIAKLCTVAIPRTPIITESQVTSEYNDLSKSWCGITLRKGTLEELSDAIRPRLQRDSEYSAFDGFQLITSYDQKCSQVESIFEGPTPNIGTFRGYRVWKTKKALVFSFSVEA